MHRFNTVHDLGRQAHPSCAGLKGSMNVKPEGVMLTSGSSAEPRKTWANIVRLRAGVALAPLPAEAPSAHKVMS